MRTIHRFKNMDKILAVHEHDMDVVVEPAVGWQDLNKHLEPRGLFFPPDPGAGVKIGGMWSLRMADGVIVRTRRLPRNSSAGFDLTGLVVGSEGTLGLVTEAVLKVTSVPENQHVAVAAFPTTQAAVKAAVRLITDGLPIDALELLDLYSLGAINHSGLSQLRWKEEPTLLLRYSGSRQAVQEHIVAAKQAAKANGCEDVDVSGEKIKIDQIWGARKQVAPSLEAMNQDSSDLFLQMQRSQSLPLLI
ncbi:MAG: hypothetical protein Q9166_000711 [cf. Caloplaca sp. 2 TL-2023]